MRFIIGEKKFANRQECKKYIQNLLRLKRVETNFLLALFAFHDDAKAKLNKLDKIGIRKNQRNTYSNEFFIRYQDGTTDAISYDSCLDGYRDAQAPRENQLSHHAKTVIKALRDEIDSQISDIRSDISYPLECEQCRKLIFNPYDCHVDHHHEKKPFRDLVVEFLELEHHTKDTVELEDVKIGGSQLQDRQLALRWQTFHKENAILRIIHKSENLQAKRKRDEENK